jgi:hypothetical protein
VRFDKIAPALIAAAFHQPDWRWVQEQCLELTGHPTPTCGTWP